MTIEKHEPNLKINTLTKAQYETIVPSDTELYFIVDDSGITSSDVITALGYTPENQANKVTTISASSTDAQYPSAKCVYNKLQNLQNSKQDVIQDLSTIRAGASLGATALQPNDNISELTNNAGYITSFDVGNGALTIQRNGTGIGTFSANATSATTVNISVPVTATDVGALPSTTTINDLTNAAQQAALNSGINAATVTQIATNTSAIAGLSSSKQDVLTAGANIQIVGNTISATDTTYTNGTGLDLSNTTFSVDFTEVATASQGNKADTALQPNDNITQLTNNAGYITNSALSGYQTTSNLVTSISASSTDVQYPSAKCVYDNLDGKQPTLVSGTNIKTVNSQSLLGSGNVTIPSGSTVTFREWS